MINLIKFNNYMKPEDEIFKYLLCVPFRDTLKIKCTFYGQMVN